MEIAFRVDIAKHIGSGHFQRCQTLAELFIANGCTCTFYSRDYTDGIANSFINDITIIGSSKVDESQINQDEKNWLGVSERQDAEDFLTALSNKKQASAIIIDHYSLGFEWEYIVKNQLKCQIIVVDDLANRKHYCDLLIDQNLYFNYKSRYSTLVPKTTIQLLGPRYSILKPNFKALRTHSRVKDNYGERRILVNFGGVANLYLWDKVIPALEMTSDIYEYTVITGRFINRVDYEILRKRLSKKGINCLETTGNMADIMANNNFALGACGSTVWERFCLGLNAALFDIAGNQTQLVKDLYNLNLVDYIGSLSELNTERLLLYLKKLDFEKKNYRNRRKTIKKLVDGNGANRIVKAVLNLF